MYLSKTTAIDYNDPWDVPLEKRLLTLQHGQRRVAYIYLWPDYYVFRYRAYNMVQALQASSSGTSAAYFTHNDLASMDRVVDNADVIVICRTKYDQVLNRIITRARAKGKTVYFDIDDLIFDVKFIPLILNTHDLDRNDIVTLDNWFAHIGRISATMQLCDRAIATNDYLADHLQPYFKEKIAVLPNFLNREQMEVSEGIYKAKKASGYMRSDRIHLGYFSGTPSHNRDFGVASDALAKILENNAQVTLRVVGPLKVTGPLQNFSSQIERFPLLDFLNLQNLISQVEGNLIPLQDNEFTNCKSELKYFEAGIVGTISIATPTYSYAGAIVDGKNGLLANSFEWYEKVRLFLDLIKSGDAKEMAENAVRHSEERYTWYNQTKLIEQTLFRESECTNAPVRDMVQVPKSLTERNDPGGVEDEKGQNQSEIPEADSLNNDDSVNELKVREKTIDSLKSELAEIHGSRAWKSISFYRETRARLLPPGSFREMPFKFINGILFHPQDTLKKTITRVNRIPKERKIVRTQNELIHKNYLKDSERLIVFLVPGVDIVNGGTMSICSLAKVSISLKPVHNSEVLIGTLPGNTLFTKYTYFENPFDIYRFDQLYTYFSKIKTLTIHLPEAFVSQFLFYLNRKQRKFLTSIPELTINILNQNVWLMPALEVVDQLKQLTERVTCTTAHSRYCTREMREYYGIPYHNFSASNLTNYYYSAYEKKENIIIISHDVHDAKEKILAKIQSEHPEISIKRIQHIAYEEYKRLISRAKWAITFGEGLDGYFVESIRSGAIPFAVYNKDFFTNRFRNLPNVYQSYEEMFKNISDDMSRLNEPVIYKSLSDRLMGLDEQEYNDDRYKDNVSRYYLGQYDLP